LLAQSFRTTKFASADVAEALHLLTKADKRLAVELIKAWFVFTRFVLTVSDKTKLPAIFH